MYKCASPSTLCTKCRRTINTPTPRYARDPGSAISQTDMYISPVFPHSSLKNVVSTPFSSSCSCVTHPFSTTNASTSCAVPKPPFFGSVSTLSRVFSSAVSVRNPFSAALSTPDFLEDFSRKKSRYRIQRTLLQGRYSAHVWPLFWEREDSVCQDFGCILCSPVKR
jgi:hypothetical protein